MSEGHRAHHDQEASSLIERIRPHEYEIYDEWSRRVDQALEEIWKRKQEAR